MRNILRYKTTKHFLITYGTIVLFSIVGYIVRSVKFDEIDNALQIKLLFISIVMISLQWESLRFINNYLNWRMPFEKGIPKRVTIQLLAGGLCGLGIRAIIYYFGEPYLPFKLDELFVAATWVLYFFLPAAVNLGFFTAHFIERWKHSLLHAQKLEMEKSQVQFDNLKNQLNPHFLFNALSSLNSLIYEDQRLASEFLQQLAKVYRYVLQNQNKTVVTLDTELNFISHYVSLLRTRFEKSLQITVDISNESKDKNIVPVTLQALIENAIKHNVMEEARPLHIWITNDEGYLVVCNNFQPRKNVDESNKKGLDNLKSLYSFLTPSPVFIQSTAEMFIVKIPLL
jgi:two-component system, LytTR family, sensor kinase